MEDKVFALITLQRCITEALKENILHWNVERKFVN